MTSAERWLVGWMRFCAVVLLLAAPAVVMPFRWMVVVNDALGLEPLIDTPLMNYLTRSLSALYVYHGLLYLFLSRDVRRYEPIIRFLAMLNVLLGLLLLLLDLVVGMPWYWTTVEGPSVILVGLVLLWLQARLDPSA